MAIVPVHEKITETVLKEARLTDGRRRGFARLAVEIAMRANAGVDEKQGREAGETNLHAMRGFVDGLMQTAEQAQHAVRRLLDRAKQDILTAREGGQYTTALTRLGQALHTVQDAALHHYEPWPYTGIGNAILTDPAYMVMHGVRDLCLIRYLVAGSGQVAGGRGGIAGEAGLATYTNNPFIPGSIGLRADYQVGGARPAEWTGMLTLCWGACPGTGGSPAASRVATPGPLGGDRSGSVFQPVWSFEAKVRPRVLEEAEGKSREFVEAIRSAAGPRWDAFVKW